MTANKGTLMTELPLLDSKTGYLLIGDFVVTGKTTLAELEAFGFLVNQNVHTQMLDGRKIRRQSASINFQQGLYRYGFFLGFTNDILDGISVRVDAPHLHTADWDDYFEKVQPEVIRVLTKWLQKQVGKLEFGGKSFDWGSVALGCDKSEDVYIVITF